MKNFEGQADLRIRRTHKLLWEALMLELSERAFEDITVKEICERAMVHRTTFYKHYVDKYSLLEQGMRQMYDALVAEVEHRPPSAFTLAQPPTYFIRLFEHVAQHQQFYRVMLCGEGVRRFQKLVKQYIVEITDLKMRELPSPAQPTLSVPKAMHVQFVAGAILGLLEWWLDNDLPLSPHQMAQYLYSRQASLPLH